MKLTILAAASLAALALAGCASGYYDRYGNYHDRYYRDHYAGPGGGVYYTDRDRYNDGYYSNYPNREYRDRDRRYRRDRDYDDE